MNTARVSVVVALVLVAVLGGVIVLVVQHRREKSRQEHCASNVKELVLALQNYHDSFLYLPYGARNRTTGKSGEEVVSWGSSWLLATRPFTTYQIPQASFDKLYSRDIAAADNDYVSAAVREPADQQKVFFMFCPSSPLPIWQQLDGFQVMVPNYAGITGSTAEPGPVGNSLVDTRVVPGPFQGFAASNGMLPINESLTFAHCTDGTANTFVVGEVSDWYYTDAGKRRNPSLSIGDAGDGFQNAAGWPAGTNLDFPVTANGSAIPPNRVCNVITIEHPIGSNNRQGRQDKAPNWGTAGIGRCGLNNPLSSAHAAGAHVGFLDGHVSLLTRQTSLLILKRLANRDDSGGTVD